MNQTTYHSVPSGFVPEGYGAIKQAHQEPRRPPADQSGFVDRRGTSRFARPHQQDAQSSQGMYVDTGRNLSGFARPQVCKDGTKDELQGRDTHGLCDSRADQAIRTLENLSRSATQNGRPADVDNPSDQSLADCSNDAPRTEAAGAPSAGVLACIQQAQVQQNPQGNEHHSGATMLEVAARQWSATPTGGSEQVLEEYICDYCGRTQTTNANLWDGKARLACFCGGRRRDGTPRVHGRWRPKGAVQKARKSAQSRENSAVFVKVMTPNPGTSVEDLPVVDVRAFNMHVYHPEQATSGGGNVQEYQCGYCGYHKVSSSAASDGMVRIRCPCGGARADGVPRMHAHWNPIKTEDAEKLKVLEQQQERIKERKPKIKQGASPVVVQAIEAPKHSNFAHTMAAVVAEPVMTTAAVTAVATVLGDSKPPQSAEPGQSQKSKAGEKQEEPEVEQHLMKKRKADQMTNSEETQEKTTTEPLPTLIVRPRPVRPEPGKAIQLGHDLQPALL